MPEPGGNRSETIAGLIQSMMQEESIYNELIRLSRAKQKTLLDFNANALQEIISNEKTVLDQLEICEKKRYQFQQELEQFPGMTNAPLRVEQLQDLMAEDEFRQLLSLKDSLHAKMGELETCNHENAGLIEQSLTFIQFSLDTLGQSSQPGYTSSGKAKLPVSYRVVNNRG